MKYKGAGIILKEDTAMAPLITRLTIAALLAAALPAYRTQDPAPKPQEVKKGDSVRVLLTNGHVVEGQVLNITATALVLRVEKLGTTVQKLASIEKITDGEKGTALGWKGVEQYEEEIKKRNQPPPTETPLPAVTPLTAPPTTTPATAPPAEPSADPGAPDRPEAVRQAEAVLKAWNDSTEKDPIQLYSDLRALNPNPARFLAKSLPLMPGTHWTIASAVLIQLKDAAVVDDLLPAFEDKRTPVRAAALNAMMQLSPRPDPYMSRLDDPDAGIRASVVQTLGRQSAMIYLQEVGRMIQDADEQVRRTAANVLTERAPLLKMADFASDWVIDGLDTSIPARRLLCVETLGSLGTDTAVKALDPLVGDEDSTIARAAVRALGRIRTLASRQAVAEALGRIDEEADPELTQDLVQAAKSVKSRGSIPRLIGFLESSNPALVKGAHQALEAISNTRGLPPSPDRWEAWWGTLPEGLKSDTETEAPAPEEQP